MQGINVDIVDQEGRSYVSGGAREPYDRTRRIDRKLAEQIRKMPYRVSVTGPHAASKQPPRGLWRLRSLGPTVANAVRQITATRGRRADATLCSGGPRRHRAALSETRIWPPTAAAVSITLMKERRRAPFGIKP